MAEIGSGVATLLDWAKQLDPDGNSAKIVEVLNQENEIVEDLMFKQGNLPTGHRTTTRTGLPTPTWRLLNQGVNPTKATTAQVDEHCGMLEDYAEADVDLASLNGNVNDYRWNEAQAHIEGMSQEFASTLFYGASTSPEEFVGLSERFNSLSADNAQNIIPAGGAGSDNSSVWLVGQGDRSFHGIFPKGSKAGIFHEDLGKQLIQTATGIGGGKMMAYVDHFQMKAGIALPDWRYVVRIPNIDVSDLTTDASTGANLITLMVQALHRPPGGTRRAKFKFYANKTIKQYLDLQAFNKTNVHLSAGEEEGRLKTKIRGIEIGTCDALLETEAAVV